LILCALKIQRLIVARRKGACRLKGKKYPLEVSSVTGVAVAAFRTSPAGASSIARVEIDVARLPGKKAAPAPPC
jgi:hypothetical protein